YFNFFMKKVVTLSFLSVFSISLPVLFAHAGKSASAPGSVVSAERIWPICIFFTCWLTFITGMGHASPLRSIVMSGFIWSLISVSLCVLYLYTRGICLVI